MSDFAAADIWSLKYYIYASSEKCMQCIVSMSDSMRDDICNKKKTHRLSCSHTMQ